MQNVVLCWMIALCCLSLLSCVGTATRPPSPEFRDLYVKVAGQEVTQHLDPDAATRFSFSAQDAPLPALLRQIADKANVSLISHSSLEKAKVSIEVKDAPVSEVLAAIARSLDRRLTRIGGIYFLGPVEPEDRSSLVRRVRRLTAEELSKITELFRSEHGRSFVSGDGLVVVADRVEVLQRLSSTFDQVETADVSSWVLQLVVVALGESTKNNLGITTSLTAKFAANLASPSLVSHDATAVFSALLESVHDSHDSFLVTQPLVVVRDGSTSVIRRGEDVRLAKRSTSPYGTSEVTGYELIKTGLTISAGLRDDTSDHANLLLKLELSSISGYQDNLPIVTTQGLDSQTSLVSGGVYLLGSLEASSLDRSLGGSPLPLSFGRQRTAHTLQIWAKAYRIGGPLPLSQQAAAAAGPVLPSARPNPFDLKGDGWKLVPVDPKKLVSPSVGPVPPTPDSVPLPVSP
jgi:type II secretory pathway component GspD/PulD (secretin)